MTNVLQFKKKISEITNVILLGEVGVEVVFTSVPLEQQLTCGEKQSDSFLQEKFREVLKKNKLNADKLRAERAQANRNVTKSYRLKK